MKRKILLLILIFTFVLSSVNASRFKFIFSKQTLPAFSDQSEEDGRIYCDTVGHWCNYAAEKLYNEGVFTGIKIGQNYYFMPDDYITRGEFLLYINAVLNIPDAKAKTLPFADKASIPSWQLPTVYSMFESGYINGNMEKGSLYFNHDEKISRLECAIVLNNFLDVNNVEEGTKYYDSYLIPKYAVSAVKNVTDYGLMQGYDDNSFRPYVKVTRAMLADVLCKLKEFEAKAG